MGLGDEYGKFGVPNFGEMVSQGMDARQQGKMQALQRQQMQQQIQGQAAETARQNAPVNPLEQDLLNLMNNRIGVKDLAAKHKALGTFNAPGGGAAVQMPQPMTRNMGATPGAQGGITSEPRMTNLSNQPTGMEGPVSANMPQAPLSRRDYNDYMSKAGPLLKPEGRDYLTELQLRNQAKLDEIVLQNKGKKDVAEVGAEARVDSAKLGADQRKVANENTIQQRARELHERAAYHKEQIAVARERIAAYERVQSEIAKTRGQKDQTLDAIIKLAKINADAMAKIESSKAIILDPKGVEKAEELQKKQDEYEAQARARVEQLKSEPQVQESETKKENKTTKTPNGANKQTRKVGDIVDIGGGRKGRITGWNESLKKWNVEPK